MTSVGAGRLEIGLQVFPGNPLQAIEEAREYEKLQFDSVWVADHFHGAGRDRTWAVPEVFTLLGAMASATSNVGLGTCVLSMLKRNAAIVAHSALTLSQISNGRFKLGLGSGFGPDLKAFGVDTSSVAARFAEAMAAIEGLMQSSPERPFNFNGRWIQLAEAFFNLPGASIPPLYIASIAPRMLALTELHGDGWLPFGLTPPIYAEFLKKLQPRSPEFTAGIWIPTFAEAKGEDRNAEAEASGKLYLSMAPQVLEAALGRGEAFGAQPTTSWTPGQAAEVRERIPRELALASTLHGSPNQIVEQLEAFRAAGCRCFVLRITDPKRRRDDARLLAERVMTVVRG